MLSSYNSISIENDYSDTPRAWFLTPPQMATEKESERKTGKKTTESLFLMNLTDWLGHTKEIHTITQDVRRRRRRKNRFANTFTIFIHVEHCVCINKLQYNSVKSFFFIFYHMNITLTPTTHTHTEEKSDQHNGTMIEVKRRKIVCHRNWYWSIEVIWNDLFSFLRYFFLIFRLIRFWFYFFL